MAICLACGSILHDDDMKNHVCLSEDLPEKGKPIRKGKTKSEMRY